MHNKKLRKKFDLEHSSLKSSQIREVQPCFTISNFVNSIQRSVNITIKKGNTDLLLMRIEQIEKITGYLFASRDYYHDYLLGLLPTISGRKKSIFL